MPGRRWNRRQGSNPGTPTLQADATIVNAVVGFGKSTPHDISPKGGKIRVRNSTGGAMAQVTASDGGATEFDVSPTALTSAPYDLQITWADLSGLARGVYLRSITLTAAGATGSPLAIPVRLEVK